MTTYIADTNIFLRVLFNDVREQAKQAKQYLADAKHGRITLIVLPITIFEIHYALLKRYHCKKEEIISYLRTIISMPYLEVVEREIWLQTLILYQEKNISLVDLFLFCKARSIDGEVLSFDKDFKKLH